MVAYSFNLRFVNPIRLGLGLDPLPEIRSKPLAIATRPKRQTIRAIGKRRHARPGENVTLYTAQRTKWCTMLGMVRCTEVQKIILWVCSYEPRMSVLFEDAAIHEPVDLEQFAQADGFGSAEEMWLFWRENHPDVAKFEGLLIRWEPL